MQYGVKRKVAHWPRRKRRQRPLPDGLGSTGERPLLGRNLTCPRSVGCGTEYKSTTKCFWIERSTIHKLGRLRSVFIFQPS